MPFSLLQVKSLYEKQKNLTQSRQDAKESQRKRLDISFALSLRLCDFACAFVFGCGSGWDSLLQ
jgi:hypothetical protein